ncbi:transcription factor stalky-like [Drosophila willistoni]|uniref:transcription factor stalky-like n=1 Tax=Drosophila willistoni TaxID=7260 RepID=UPI001F072C25|nr:transcription factor stalky-like [Drosophila willistoni]
MASKGNKNDSDQDTNNNIDDKKDTHTNVDLEDNSDVNAIEDVYYPVEDNIENIENKNNIKIQDENQNKNYITIVDIIQENNNDIIAKDKTAIDENIDEIKYDAVTQNFDKVYNKEKDTQIDLEDNDNNKGENNITNDTHVENGNQKDVEQKDGDKERPISHTSAKRKRVEMDDELPSTSKGPIKIFKVSEDTKYYIFENDKRNNDQEEGDNPDVVVVVKDENDQKNDENKG